jgi:hypothetical protein
MGMCSYCGRSAGLFRSKHAECETKHKQGWSEMARLAMQAVSGQVSLDTVEPTLTEIAHRSYIPTNQCRQVDRYFKWHFCATTLAAPPAPPWQHVVPSQTRC